jgi:hypothetical protein
VVGILLIMSPSYSRSAVFYFASAASRSVAETPEFRYLGPNSSSRASGSTSKLSKKARAESIKTVGSFTSQTHFSKKIFTPYTVKS